MTSVTTKRKESKSKFVSRDCKATKAARIFASLQHKDKQKAAIFMKSLNPSISLDAF